MKNLLAILILMVSISILVLLIDIHYMLKDENITINRIEQSTTEDINDSLLYDYIKSLNIKYPKVVLAQAKLESHNYKSSLFRQNKNLFGMRVAAQRATTAQGMNDFARYHSWHESVLDYALWQNRMIKGIKSEDDYLWYLGKYYAEDTKYVDKILGIMKKN